MKTAVLIVVASLLTLLVYTLCKVDKEIKSPDLSIKNALKAYAAAEAFISSLDEDERKICLFDYDDIERKNWHFTVKERPGLPWEKMGEKQRELGVALLKSGLSEYGYEKARQIMELEVVLRLVEKRPPNDRFRHPELYQFSFFGLPHEKNPWGWRFEGHHVSLNFSHVNSKTIVTPLFMGANPAIVPYGPKKGLQVLEKEQQLARQIMNTLADDQLKSTIYDAVAPPELVHEVAHHISSEKFEGVAVNSLSADQQGMIKELITVYTDRVKKEQADKLWKHINDQWSSIHFAWAGGIKAGDKHYYRIHGNDLWIEYDNTQNDGNHIHSIFRSIHNDFAQKTLADHYAEHEH